jgi:hypothetical protein
MTDQPDNHTLEILRALWFDLSNVKETVIDIERRVIQLQSADAKHADDEAHMNRRLRDGDLRY